MESQLFDVLCFKMNTTLDQPYQSIFAYFRCDAPYTVCIFYFFCYKNNKKDFRAKVIKHQLMFEYLHLI